MQRPKHQIWLAFVILSTVGINYNCNDCNKVDCTPDQMYVYIVDKDSKDLLGSSITSIDHFVKKNNVKTNLINVSPAANFLIFDQTKDTIYLDYKNGDLDTLLLTDFNTGPSSSECCADITGDSVLVNSKKKYQAFLVKVVK